MTKIHLATLCCLSIAWWALSYCTYAEDQVSTDAAIPVIFQQVDAVVKAGEHPKVWVTILGGRTNCRIVSADANMLKVDIQGNAFPLRWKDITADYLVGIAESVAGEKGDRLVFAAKAALLLGYVDRASDILARARNSDDSLKATISALTQEIAQAQAKSNATAAAPAKKTAASATPAQAAAPAKAPVQPEAVVPPLGPPGGSVTTAGKSGRVLKVGANKQYKTGAEAARAVKNGDIVEIDAGVYKGDVMTWSADDILIRGVGGMAHFDADGKNEGGKATWVVRGHNIVIENIEFSNAVVPDKNGAGIRIECSSMTLRNCYFHDNEDGVLGGNDSELLFECCEFYNNGAGDGYSHNMYIGHAKSFTLRYCYSHGAKIGHNVKSRAAKNVIMYNRIMDESEGTASYTIDLPNGGLSYVVGNLIQKGPKAQNNVLFTYAEEGGSNPEQRLYVVNNTFSNDHGGGAFVSIRGNAAAVVMNNLFLGGGNAINGKAEDSGNLATQDEHAVMDRANYDYRLTDSSVAHGKGVKPIKVDDFDCTPIWQYVHKASAAKRVNAGTAFDVGAYEFGFKEKEPVKVAAVDPPAKTKPPDPKPPSKPATPPPPPVQRTPEQICQGWFTMAMNYKSANFKEDAILYLNKIVASYPNTEWATKARTELTQLGG